MRTMKTLMLTMAVCFALIFSGCSQRLVDFTVISSKNHSLNLDRSQGKQVKGVSNGVFGIGTSIKDAMDNALQSAGPDYDLLVDGVVRMNNYYFVAGYTVTGTAVSSSKMKGLLGEEGFEEWCSSNNIYIPEDTE